MKKSVIVRKCVPFFLCCLLILSVLGCSSGTPSSAEGIPLLLRYTDSTQHEDKLLRMTWNPEKGTADIDMNAALSFKNTATKLDFWVPLGLQYGVSAEGALPSNTAIYWNGADRITLFTSEEYSSEKLQGNSLSADIVTVRATPLCKQYFNAANCYTTSTTLYSISAYYKNVFVLYSAFGKAVVRTINYKAVAAFREQAGRYRKVVNNVVDVKQVIDVSLTYFFNFWQIYMGSILGVGVNKLYGPCHTHLSFDYSFLLQTVKYSLYSTGGFFTYQFPNFPYGRRYTFGFDERLNNHVYLFLFCG